MSFRTLGWKISSLTERSTYHIGETPNFLVRPKFQSPVYPARTKQNVNWPVESQSCAARQEIGQQNWTEVYREDARGTVTRERLGYRSSGGLYSDRQTGPSTTRRKGGRLALLSASQGKKPAAKR